MDIDNWEAPTVEKGVNQETKLDALKYHARVRVMKDSIEAIRCWYLQDADLQTESATDFEHNPQLSISIKGLNPKAESLASVNVESAKGSVVDGVVENIPTPKNLKFHLDTIVNAVVPPDRKLLTSNGKIILGQQLGDITVASGEDGFCATSDSFDTEQQGFFLELMSRTLGNVLDKAKKGRIRLSNYETKPSDEIVYDHSLITATDDNLKRDLASESDREKYAKSRDTKISQLNYIKSSIDEARSKIKI